MQKEGKEHTFEIWWLALRFVLENVNRDAISRQVVIQKLSNVGT